MAWTATVGLVLTLWFLASVVHQFDPPRWSRISRHDRYALLPRWRFFAPNPGRDDRHLVVRDEVVPGVAGRWRPVALDESKRSWRWLWQPSRYGSKALSDLVSGLLGTLRALGSTDFAPGAEQLSGSYLGLLRWSLIEPAAEGAKRQFAVVASNGHGESRSLRIVYLSGWHAAGGDNGC